MLYVELTKGKKALIDEQDYCLVSQYKWRARYSKGNYYAETNIYGDNMFMHNLIMGRREGHEVDHRDQNGLNNSRSNLRFAAPSQNRANVRTRTDNKSGYKGVCFNKKTSKWRAYIQKDMGWKHIGMFGTKEEAAVAYNDAAKELFGEFAWLNNL